jgi:hypothetical protein
MIQKRGGVETLTSFAWGVSHCVLEGSDASHQGSLAALEGNILNVLTPSRLND